MQINSIMFGCDDPLYVVRLFKLHCFVSFKSVDMIIKILNE